MGLNSYFVGCESLVFLLLCVSIGAFAMTQCPVGAVKPPQTCKDNLVCCKYSVATGVYSICTSSVGCSALNGTTGGSQCTEVAFIPTNCSSALPCCCKYTTPSIPGNETFYACESSQGCSEVKGTCASPSM